LPEAITAGEHLAGIDGTVQGTDAPTTGRGAPASTAHGVAAIADPPDPIATTATNAILRRKLNIGYDIGNGGHFLETSLTNPDVGSPVRQSV
jgi:hypothetical protein